MIPFLVACTTAQPFSDAQVSAAVAAGSQVDPERLMAHVNSLVGLHANEAPYWPPESRYVGMPLTHVDSCQYIQDEVRSYGLDPQVDTGGTTDRPICTPWADIVGTTHPDEIVLLSAHHDAWFVGADDNSTGVAVILETARILAQTPLDRTVRIISFDREEEGLVGAADYARKHGAKGLYRQINLDSVGYTDTTPGSQASLVGLDAPSTGDFIAAIAPETSRDDLMRALALGDVLPEPVKAIGVVANGDAHAALLTDLLRSDHAPFWAMGVPGIFLSDTTDFRNPRYHTALDTPDTLDPVFFGEVGAFTTALTAAFATTPAQ